MRIYKSKIPRELRSFCLKIELVSFILSIAFIFCLFSIAKSEMFIKFISSVECRVSLLLLVSAYIFRGYFYSKIENPLVCETRRQLYLNKIKKRLGASLGVFTIIMPINAYASDKLTDLFKMDAFRGSMSVISKFQWVGWLLNAIISVTCLIGLFLILYSTMVSLLYLSARPTFDRVNEIKKSSAGSPFGLKGLFDKSFVKSETSGLDNIVVFLLGMLPDIKKASDFGEGKHYNFDDDVSALQYMLKVSPQRILLIFLFSIGYSGIMMQIYGNIVDGMSVFAQAAADVNLEKYATMMVTAGKRHQFSFGDKGTNLGDLQQKLATKIYSECLAKCETQDTDTRLSIGENIEKNTLLSEQSVRDWVGQALGKDGKSLTDDDFKKVSYNVTVSGTKASSDNKGRQRSIDFGQFAGSNVVSDKQASGYFINMTLYPNGKENAKDFFKKKNSGGPSSNTQGTSRPVNSEN